MPQMASITLNNHAAVAVTYTVLQGSGPVYGWADTAQGTPGGFRTITMEVKRPPDATKGVNRVLVKMARPFVNVTTGVVDYVIRKTQETIVPVQATLAERREMLAMDKNFHAHANYNAACVDLDGMY